MLILAIDTALNACSAGILDSDANRLVAHESQAMPRGHAEALMPMIERVMTLSGVSYAALDRIAVTVGPGSFTGLRVGISAARGIALAAEKPVVGVTTLSAYAAPFLSEAGGAIVSLIDARHDHVYAQIVGGDGAAMVRPSVLPIADILATAERLEAPRLVGDAARMIADRWPQDVPQPAVVETQAAPDIAWVAWLGVAANPEHALARPLYLRAPDAKPQTPAALDQPAPATPA